MKHPWAEQLEDQLYSPSLEGDRPAEWGGLRVFRSPEEDGVDSVAYTVEFSDAVMRDLVARKRRELSTAMARAMDDAIINGGRGSLRRADES